MITKDLFELINGGRANKIQIFKLYLSTFKELISFVETRGVYAIIDRDEELMLKVCLETLKLSNEDIYKLYIYAAKKIKRHVVNFFIDYFILFLRQKKNDNEQTVLKVLECVLSTTFIDYFAVIHEFHNHRFKITLNDNFTLFLVENDFVEILEWMYKQGYRNPNIKTNYRKFASVKNISKKMKGMLLYISEKY